MPLATRACALSNTDANADETPKALFPTLFDRSTEGKRGVTLPETGLAVKPLSQTLPAGLLADELPRLPQLSQLETVRHFVNLSQLNHAIDTGFYPLGSCTMKYNPKVCDAASALEGFAGLHPMAPEDLAQGTLELIYTLQCDLADITGFDAVSLQPAAGAQGELVGMMMIKKHFEHTGQTQRTQVIVPDSAHGTNPASAVMCGFDIIEIATPASGLVDLDALKAVLSAKTAALMLTNPSTLGLFERDILEITRLVHEAGGLMYYDGANLNAVLGHARPADMGFDVMHINTHKTFATPHGGGGPGCGPVAVTAQLAPYLPAPLAAFDGNQYFWDTDRPLSIGRVKAFWGNVDMMVRAFTYIRAYGAQGLAQVSTDAVLNANYVRHHLANTFEISYPGLCKHEFVMNSHNQKGYDERLSTLTIAKRLMDYGIHPMTMYFPLIAHEAMMIEPTDTESKATLDHFIAVMKRIDHECRTEPDTVLSAPHTMPIAKVDEVQAARQPQLSFFCCPA